MLLARNRGEPSSQLRAAHCTEKIRENQVKYAEFPPRASSLDAPRAPGRALRRFTQPEQNAFPNRPACTRAERGLTPRAARPRRACPPSAPLATTRARRETKSVVPTLETVPVVSVLQLYRSVLFLTPSSARGVFAGECAVAPLLEASSSGAFSTRSCAFSLRQTARRSSGWMSSNRMNSPSPRRWRNALRFVFVVAFA